MTTKKKLHRKNLIIIIIVYSHIHRYSLSIFDKKNSLLPGQLVNIIIGLLTLIVNEGGGLNERKAEILRRKEEIVVLTFQ